MARPTLSRLSGVPSRAPEQREAPRLGVFAPLDVRAPRDNTADFLVQALGIATPGIEAVVNRRRKEAGEAGAADAMLNRVDPKRAAKDREYGYAAGRVEAEAKAREAIREWNERYTTEIDKAAATEDVARDFDAFMQERLAPFTADPRFAGPVAAILTDSLQNVLGAHQKAQADEFRAVAVANAGDAIREAVLAGKPAPIMEQHALLRSLVGGREANEALVDLVGSIAQERGDPALIDALLPEKWADGTPGVRSIGSLNSKLNQYAYYAARAREEQQSAAAKAAEQAVDAEMLEITRLAGTGQLGQARQRLDVLARSGAIERTDYAAMVGFLDGREDRFRSINFPAAKYADARSQLATDFKSRTVAEWNALGVTLAAALPPGDRDRFMAQWADDVRSEASRDQTSTPAASNARDLLKATLTPSQLDVTNVGKGVQANALFEFNKRVAAGEDPEKVSRELIDRDLPKINNLAKVAPGSNVEGLVKGLSTGAVTETNFRAAYADDPDAVGKIRDALRKGQITQDEARRALTTLSQ